MRFNCKVKTLGLALLCLSLSAQSTEPDTTFDAKDYEYCLVCHGSVGQGNPAVDAPVLAGMEDWSLRNQLQAFREGWRGSHALDLVGMEMRPAALALEESELRPVGRYIEALPAQSAPTTGQGDRDAGRAVYQACAACHGTAAEGDEELQAPALAYQDDSYLERQLKNFRDGIRGSHPEDLRGARMADSARDLDDAAIANVVSYIRSMSP
ncbi:c-type cytochrome [Congregibacter sp.]|uniref:c-type cytochrome n=1 Tax=Congregibacter sp. TaxID=2744308 RepID=UPI003F6D600E